MQLSDYLKRSSEMTIDQVKKAVDAGKTVYADTKAYRVIFDRGEYRIICLANGYTVNLHGAEGSEYADVMNGKCFWSID